MRLKLDENIPFALAAALRALGHDVDTTLEEGLLGQRDEAIWTAAQSASRALITQDLDFSDTRRFAPGSHHGIILVRLHSPSRAELLQCVVDAFSQNMAQDWSRCVVVISEFKVRVRSQGPPVSS